jgi:alcohol dehydrogenase (cytochrome c)
MKRLLAMAVFSAAVTGVVGVGAQDRTRSYVPVTDAMLQKPDASDWLMWRRTLDGWGYSPLNQINRNNVGQLKMVWAHGLGPGNQEGTPLVHDGVMYVPDPGDHILAVDV